MSDHLEAIGWRQSTLKRTPSPRFSMLLPRFLINDGITIDLIGDVIHEQHNKRYIAPKILFVSDRFRCDTWREQ